MKSRIVKSVAFSALLVLSTTAAAIGKGADGAVAVNASSFPDVIETWGSGISRWAARDDARASGHQACLNAGASFSSFEEVQSLKTGGGWITYGLSYCY